LTIINRLNVNRSGAPRAAEFEEFWRVLRLPSERTHLLTRQGPLARVEATFDPGVRPLLDHVYRLHYLQSPEG
jgi:hypothetical protein